MTQKSGNQTQTTVRAAEIVREYGFPGVDKIAGVTHDGRRVWAATGAKLMAFDPDSGAKTSFSLINNKLRIAGRCDFKCKLFPARDKIF